MHGVDLFPPIAYYAIEGGKRPRKEILMNNNNSCLCNLFDNNCTWLVVIALIILLFHCNGNGCGCGNF